MVAARRPNTEIIHYHHGQLVPGRQSAPHDPAVPGGEILGIRTPPTRSPRLAPISVAPQVPKLALSTPPLHHSSLSRDMKKAFQGITEAAQTAQDAVIGDALTSQLPFVRGPSIPTVLLLHDSGSLMRRKSNDNLPKSVLERSRFKRFV